MDNLPVEQQGFESPPILNLDIEDEKLIRYIDNFSKNAKAFYEKKNIDKRREVIRRFYFGDQLQGRHYSGLTIDRELKSYEKPFVDNVLKEAEDVLRTLVLSRLPDVIVNPGVESQLPRETAELLSEAINKTLHSDELKKILTQAFRHHPLNFTAVIKWLWSPNKGKLGDIDWEVIPPKNILMDYMATSNEQSKMKIIIHYVENALFDWIMLFPQKEEELKKHAHALNWQEAEDPDGRAFTLKVEEVWFEWQDKAENFDPEIPEFDFKSAVLWKIGSKDQAVILDKRLNPNWDWEGEEKPFFNDRPVPDELTEQMALVGFNIPEMEMRKVYRNYFGKPRKPFIFMGYEQYGEMPLDETSRLEENLILQENYDMRGMQISKMIDDAKGKSVYSRASGLKKETIEEQDPNNPDEDMFIDGDLRQVHAYIKKEQPSQAMFADLNRSRERIMEKYHLSGSVRGEITSDTATTNQIAREGSFTIADDISDLTINEVATKMAEALLHMMKLRYTPQHFMALLGKDAEKVHENLTADVIDDGMEVTIEASSTDKLKIEREAKEEAQLGITDPVNYLKDTGRPDAERRAEAAYLWAESKPMYYEKFIKKREVADTAQMVMGQNQQNLAQAGVGGAMGQPPLQPSPQQTTNIPVTPQGSPRSLIGRAGSAIGSLFNRGA